MTDTRGRSGDHSPVSYHKEQPQATRPHNWLLTLIVHALSIVLAIIYVSLLGHLVDVTNSGGVDEFVGFGAVGFSAHGAALLFCASELVARLVHHDRRGWLPAVNIGLSIVITLLSLAMSGMLTFLYHLRAVTEDGFRSPSECGVGRCYDQRIHAPFLTMVILTYVQAALHLINFGAALGMHQKRKVQLEQAQLARNNV